MSLQEYAAGEVDPAERAVIARHVEACADCRTALKRIEALRSMIPVVRGPDDVAWQRIQHRVRHELEASAAERLGRTIGWPSRMLAAGLAVAAAIALMVWLAPRDRKGAPRDPEPSAEVATVASGRTPLDVELESARLRLERQSRLRLLSEGARLELELQAGGVFVDSELVPQLPGEITIRTPSFSATSSSGAFGVSQVGTEFYVDVKRGEVRLTGGAAAGRIVHEGQRVRVAGKRRVAVTPAPAPEPAPPPSPVAEPTPTPKDPWVEKWRQASVAFYEERNVELAVELAEEIVAAGGGRPEVRWAQALLCEALVTAGRPADAATACTKLLAGERDEARRRAVHHRLAHLHRTQLGDCRSALPHYSAAIVFGQRSQLNDDALFGRAHCALETGDLDQAGLDIAVLERRSKDSPRWRQVIELRKRLQARIGEVESR